MSISVDERKRLFAKRIRQAMDERRYSLRDVARLAGVSFSHLAKLIREEVPLPKPGYCDKLAKALNIPYTELLFLAGRLERPYTYQPAELEKIKLQLPANANYDTLIKFYLEHRRLYTIQRALFDDFEPIKKLAVTNESDFYSIFKEIKSEGEKNEFIYRAKHFFVPPPKETITYDYDEIYFVLQRIPVDFLRVTLTPNFRKQLLKFKQAFDAALQLYGSDYKSLWVAYDAQLEALEDAVDEKDEEEKPEATFEAEFVITTKPDITVLRFELPLKSYINSSKYLYETLIENFGAVINVAVDKDIAKFFVEIPTETYLNKISIVEELANKLFK